ncbi:MAG: helix-turn-helix domain-containing protein [Eubacteriales bacterium]|nr:helix-turn-helix domain-containing protein [Eubacteriales bacterium]
MKVLSILPIEAESGCGCSGQDSAIETSPLHSHTFYEFFYVFSGRAIHHINDKNSVVSQGSLVFIRPHDVHTYFPIESYNFALVSLGFEPEALETLVRETELDIRPLLESATPPCVPLKGSDRLFVEKCLRSIQQSAFGLERRRLFHVFFPLFFYLMEKEQSSKDELIPPWLSFVVEQMSKRENFTVGLSQLYDLSGYSAEYTTRCFRKYLNTTPTELINNNRINYAAKLLRSTKDSVADVCYAVGFNNLSYFYDVFRKFLNCTPGRYARQMRRQTELQATYAQI